MNEEIIKEIENQLFVSYDSKELISKNYVYTGSKLNINNHKTDTYIVAIDFTNFVMVIINTRTKAEELFYIDFFIRDDEKICKLK